LYDLLIDGIDAHNTPNINNNTKPVKFDYLVHRTNPTLENSIFKTSPMKEIVGIVQHLGK